ncbi:NAD/NADP transhydrogenase alpha subunit-like protein [Azospirillum palustre]|uniref:NAD/NADP transhydrogenase alpha subunit-like protein n=1 Tax=Azospirillum palustre TaxID=2044885 RepID=A0A2B8BML9_9PROT|nr:NAD/NADP transhydrogenase alpha subunit-like protein [Azospirillum palustre]PGH59191.1 NAD/NADP transhydrogenase alpha subunit-like protein [Azospirillum palustre]
MRSLTALDDAMGRPSLAIASSDTVLAVLLTAGAPRQIPVPAGARIVLFSATAPFWARIGGAAGVPAADVLDGSAAELNPVARQVRGAGFIGLAAAANTTVSLSFYG